MFRSQGFTLLEVLLVAALLAMIAGFSIGIYDNYGRNADLNSTAKNIIYDLRQMRSAAAAGENRRNWGMHLVNGSQDYYELFSSPTNYADPEKTMILSEYLPAGLHFVSPAEGISQDVIFASITGDTAAAAITIASSGSSVTINITASGAVD
ncbi:MAG TPA: prepilin-type N-terminal cleavage/methylation domain-containing protein [Candidatus Methylomirabilis sp.]|nr:prepilin-type N-terminal cleavage/methylation domain-containing protein [Candidatus Methylomirabilis sp.]